MSGNVWEWTHSLMKAYPYNVKDGREDEKTSNARVLRGGSFDLIERSSRCACRSSRDLLSNGRGFRVVASPVLS
jgi:formylglycine-generating enzyme required for sulfatase activity